MVSDATPLLRPMVSNSNVYRAFVFIASGGLLFGYIIGITSNVVTSGQLLCESGVDTKATVGTWTSYGYGQCYDLGALQKGLLTSLNLIGACLASLVCFRYADDLGRKLEVQLGAALYFVGGIIAAASPVLWGIYIGFTIYGLGIGFAMHAAPVYIAEVSPAQIRGMLVSAKEAVIVCGMFLGFFFGWAFSNIATDGWRIMVVISAFFALVMGIGVSFIPESPRYLVLKAVRSTALLRNDSAQDSQELSKAHTALSFYRDDASQEEVAEELEQIRSDISASIGAEVAKVTDTFKYPKPLLIGCGLVFLQQVTGQPSVLYYATNIFKSAGFGSAAALSSVFVGLVKLLATLFTVWRVDKFGRVLLLTVGIGMMIVALSLIGTAFMFRECETEHVSVQDCDDKNVSLPQSWATVTVAGLMLYVSGYQVGFGPISWLMISEIFPLKVRGGAMSIAAIVNFGSNIMMTLLQQVLQDALTPAGLFFAYLVLSVVSIAFVQTIVPETKGKTLEEIEAMLSGNRAREVCA
eukprot:TRINITY_DN1311_c0_g2_i1.p1 TRINITY_DN1311_c0_g2~~TRINITY_DN1311_c0_g2_i1.p1  ORF type:complete len:523 (-),score=112.12 TRINITY_DN1311_c0_g2_i1:376-1944(-)